MLCILGEQIQKLLDKPIQRCRLTLQQRMADDSNDEVKAQVYYNYRQFATLYFDYERGYLRATQDQFSLLLSAKGCFFKQKYEDCRKILKKVRQDHHTKILFERQALMFKTVYLLQPDNIAELENIIRQYDRYKTRCPGKPLTDFHHNTMRELMDCVVKGKQYKLNASGINKQQLRDQIKAQQKRTKYQGLPSYLISAGWNKKFNDFLLKNGPHPGPMTNFEIINHVFELDPHQQPSKDYMDKLLFPVTQETNYFVINRRHWKMLQDLFWGYPVKRVFTIDPKNRQISGGDHLIKTLIQYQNNKIVMQWQQGTYWDKSVMPVLVSKFGTGQLKQETRNKDFLIIQPGRIEQPTTRLKYIKVDTNLIKVSTEKQEERKKKILASYDLQKYNPDEFLPRGTVGLANLGNTCYMNSALQFLANLKTLSNYLLTNRYLARLNISESNKDGSYGEVTCAYADLVKRMWFSPKQTRYIDPTLFKKVFGERYSMFDGFEQQDAQQYLMFLLNCLHEDLNQNAQMNLAHRQSMTGKAFDSVLKSAVAHYNKHNKSIISDLFHGFNYQEIKCDQCQFTTYRFQHSLMLHLQVPPQAPKITLFYVEMNNFKQAKRVEVYIKNLQTLDQIFAVLRRYFNTDKDHDYIPFLYSDDPKNWQDLHSDDGINYISKQQQKQCSLFVYEVRKPEPDQQIAMMSYFHEGKIKGLQCDGFPRILVVKKSFKDKQFEEELQDLVFSTIPRQKIQRDKKQYIKQIKHKKLKDKPYTSQYKVYLNQRISNYSNVSNPKILGESDIEGTINLEGVLQKMRKKQIIDQNQKWFCQKCRCVRSAHKTDKIYSTGKYLIIQFKRFTEKGKVTTKIDYPINSLNMRPYTTAEKGRFDTFTYNLQGVILHRGSLNSGHYTCLCRSSDKSVWLNYDDESVREIDESLVVDCNAYMLLYERADENQSYISIPNGNL